MDSSKQLAVPDWRQVLAATRWYASQIGEQFLAHDCLTRAGSLTYTTLFAVVPMMTVAYSMFSILPAYEGLEERIQEFIFNNFVPDSSAAVQEKLIEFSDRARRLTIVGFIFLFGTSFLLLVTIEKTFNAIWRTAEPRQGLQRILVYWGVLSLGPSMIISAILISAYFASLPLVSDLDVFGLTSVFLRNLPLLLTWLGFTILYVAMPNCHVRFSHGLLGGFLTMLTFEIAKVVFNWAVLNTSIAPIYGTFAAVPFFLFWMYMVWVLILCGAIVVRTMSLSHESPGAQPEPVLVKCSRVLELVLAGHLQGKGVSDKEINNRVRLTSDEHDRVFATLKDLKLLSRDEEDRWRLARSLKTLTLWDLYQQLPDGVDSERLAAVEGMDHVVEPLRALMQFGSNQMSVSLDSVFGGVG